jgi:hypothetical protein
MQRLFTLRFLFYFISLSKEWIHAILNSCFFVDFNSNAMIEINFCTVLLRLNIYFNRSLWSTTNQTMIKCTQDLISLHNLIESILQTVILFALSAIKRIKIKQLKRLFESRNSVWKWIFLSLLFSKLSNRK